MGHPNTSERKKAIANLVQHRDHIINGKTRESLSGRRFKTEDPATGETLALVAEGGEEDIQLAIDAAGQCLESATWKKMSARERGSILYRWADLLEKNSQELALLESLDGGKPISSTRSSDVPGAIEVIRYFAGWADKISGTTLNLPGPYHSYTRREPVGICGQIIPWNYPMNMAAWKIAPAIAAGCTIVLKPAEQTPLSALAMGTLALEAGLPPGALNIVNGFGDCAGASLVGHSKVQKIAFTGSTATAQAIQRQTAMSMKRVSFELGGKSPNIVMKDADIEQAVEGCFGAIFSNMGQNCCAGSRLFLQESIYEEFLEKLLLKTSNRVIGDTMNPETEHGPQISREQRDRIAEYVESGKREGAKLLCGGRVADSPGYYFEPTIFSEVSDEMRIAREEIFGPVLCVMRFTDPSEALRRANNSAYGLAAGVWTKSLSLAHKCAQELQTGTVWVNCYNNVDPGAPFGGYKMSGIGRELSEQAFQHYTEVKTVTMRVH